MVMMMMREEEERMKESKKKKDGEDVWASYLFTLMQVAYFLYTFTMTWLVLRTKCSFVFRGKVSSWSE